MIAFSPNRSFAQDCSNLPAFQITWNNQTISQPSVYNNQNIRVTGTVTFNANVTMVRCTVLLDPGATIRVGAGVVFTASGDANGSNVFFGCTGMWKSIVVGNNAAIRFRRCRIQDSESGINFQGTYNWAVTELVDNSFRGNYVSITASFCPNLSFGAFSGNYFSSYVVSFLGIDVPFPILISPYAGEYPFAGVLTAAVGSLGTSGQSPNTFTYLRHGIYSVYSILNINNCIFQKSINTALTNTDGAGIYAEGSTLKVENLFGGPGCTFSHNPEAGILSKHTYGLNVSDATFNGDNKYGIRVINSINTALVNIENNTFALEGPNTLSAISFVRPPSTGSLTRCYINNNVITVPDPATTGFKNSTVLKLIEVQALEGPATDNMVIADNYITSYYGGDANTIHGVWVEDHSDGYQISGNNIKYDYDVSQPPPPGVNNVGIGVTSVHGVRNIIGPNNNTTAKKIWLGDSPNADFRRSYLRCGIHADDSPNFLICRNLADFTFQGYHFARNCGGDTDLGMNRILNHCYGLNLCTGGGCDQSTVFNAQPYRENLWEVANFFQVNPARWWLAPLLPPQFRVDGTQTFHVPSPQADINPPNWFFITYTNPVSEMTACDSLLSPEIPRFRESEEAFMAGEYHLNHSSADWDYEIFILGHLLRFPSLLNGDLQTQQYYTSRVESSPWKYAKAESLLRESYIPNASQQSQLDALLASTRILSDSLAHLEYLESIDTTSLTPSITVSRTSVMAALEQNRVQTLAVGEALRDAALTNLESVYDYVSELPAVEIWEQNRKTVLQYIVAYAMGNEPTETDLQALRLVAEQCPATGGTAVTMARSRLPKEEASLFPLEGEDPYCIEERASEKTSIFEGEITLSPNPVSNYLIVSMSKPTSGSWQIAALNGHVLTTGVFSDTERFEINVRELPQGSYHLQLHSTEHPVALLRFIKI